MSNFNEFLVTKLRQISYKYNDEGDRERAIAYNKGADALERAPRKIRRGGEAATRHR